MTTRPHPTVDESLELTDEALHYVDDPHYLLARIRDEAPVCRVTFRGVPVWLVTRHADIRRALLNPCLASDPRHATGAARAAPWVFATESHVVTRNMVRSDPPYHMRLRKSVVGEFTTQRTNQLKPHIERVVNDLIDEFLPLGRTDLIADFGRRLPLSVISTMMGVPQADRDLFTELTSIWIGTNRDDDELRPAAITGMRDYLTALVERKIASARKGEHGDGVLDRLVATADLDPQEIVAMGFLLMVAGFETAANLIGNSVLALLRNPDQLAILKREPALIGPAMDEFLRFDGPVKVAPVLRFTTAEVELGGVTIPGGGKPVLLAYAAANRDPARFAAPDRLDVLRDSSGHLGFGYGAHHCLGAPLAKVEAEIAIGALLRRCANLALATDTILWGRGRFIRGLRELPVTFDPVPPGGLGHQREDR